MLVCIFTDLAEMVMDYDIEIKHADSKSANTERANTESANTKSVNAKRANICCNFRFLEASQ